MTNSIVWNLKEKSGKWKSKVPMREKLRSANQIKENNTGEITWLIGMFLLVELPNENKTIREFPHQNLIWKKLVKSQCYVVTNGYWYLLSMLPIPIGNHVALRFDEFFHGIFKPPRKTNEIWK